MAKLFTMYEAIQAPKVIPKEIQQNYEDIQEMSMEEDNSGIADSEVELEAPKFHYPEKISSQPTVIDIAKQYIGSNYKWGGTNPSTGFDCSGLMQYVFKQVGINLPRTAMQQGRVGEEVDEAQPGDLIWFGSKNSPSGQHIGLVSRIDNGQIYIIDAAGKKLGVTERPLPNLQIKSIRRITGNFSDTVLNFFMNKGLSENQARGILGNLLQESRGNHNIVNKTSGAFGLAQWLGPRKQKLMQKYGKNPTTYQQLEFIWEELNTTEKDAFQKLLNTNTIADATRVFANHFERAGKDEMNMNQRISYAYS